MISVQLVSKFLFNIGFHTKKVLRWVSVCLCLTTKPAAATVRIDTASWVVRSALLLLLGQGMNCLFYFLNGYDIAVPTVP